jgi:hypothetical protein
MHARNALGEMTYNMMIADPIGSGLAGYAGRNGAYGNRGSGWTLNLFGKVNIDFNTLSDGIHTFNYSDGFIDFNGFGQGYTYQTELGGKLHSADFFLTKELLDMGIPVTSMYSDRQNVAETSNRETGEVTGRYFYYEEDVESSSGDQLGGMDGLYYTGFGHHPYGAGNDDESPVQAAIPIAITLAAADGPIPIGDVLGAVVVSGAIAYDATQRNFVTYTMRNSAGQVYVGRTSGFGDPYSIVKRRTSYHHMRFYGYGSPMVDRAIQGYQGYPAIRGREQQMIDFFGGVGSLNVGNRIRGVSKSNMFGRLYHEASNMYFGEVAPYSGF